MSHHFIRALRIALLAMVGALVFETTKQTVIPHISIWGSHTLTIFFITASTFAASVVMLLREEKSRSVLLGDIEQRQKTEQQLHLQAAALESAANAIVITDRDSAIVWVNPAFSKLTGYSAEEVLGKTPRLLKSGQHDPGFYKVMWRRLLSGSVWRGEMFNRRKDGSLYLEEATITPVRATGGDISHFIAVKVDITEHKRSELELHRLNRTLSTLSGCNSALVHATDETQLLNQICETVVHVGGYRLAWIGYAKHDEGKTVQLMAKSGIDDGYTEKVQVTWDETGRGCGPGGTAIKTGEVCLLRDILQDPRFTFWRDDAVQRGYASVISLPLREGSQIIGTLNIYSSEPDAFDDPEVKLLKELADDLSYGINSLRNATERKRAEEAVRQSEAELRSFVDKSPFGIFRTHIEEDRFLSVNPAVVKMLGYATAEELLSAKLSTDVYVNLHDRDKSLMPLLRDGFSEVEIQCRRKNGETIHIQLSGRLVQESSICGSYFEGIAEDITERKRAQHSLHESEGRFRKLLELAPLPLALATEGGVITFRNQRFVSVFGYTAEDVPTVSEWWNRAYPDPEYRQWAINRWDAVVRAASEDGRDIQPTEANITCKNGEVRILEVSGITLGDKVLATFIDITERKRTEQSLRGSEKRYRMLFDHNLAAVFHSSGGKLLDCNEAMCEMLGYKRDELFEFDLRKLYRDPAARDAGQRLLYECGQLTNHQVDLRRKDGSIVTILANLNRMDGEPGQAPVVVGVMLDITQVRKLQEKLSQSQKMEAVGRLAGGIAHDFNNLLMVIQSYTEMLQDKLPAHDKLRKNTEQVLKAADRAASLTGQMLAFSRKQITAPVVLDLNSVIDDTAKMLKRLIGEDIEFRVALAKSLWTVLVDEHQIVQVLMNLCINARDAMPQGGMLTIATDNFRVKRGSVEGHPDMGPGEYVKLSVTDTGTGICKPELEKIFEPFFTTKEVGKGTGLGLATVYGIVKQNGGYVWVDSECGQGASFTICLPKAEGLIASAVSPETDAQPRGMGTILVAEDEDALREAICAYLLDLGYTVLTASSGQHALSVANEYEGHIDLLITDVVMPKISGRELSQTLGRSRPRLKTIHMSGYTDDAVLRHGIHDMDATFLQKPFNLSMLARKVRDILGRNETVQ